jgi:hypothetical protein
MIFSGTGRRKFLKDGIISLIFLNIPFTCIAGVKSSDKNLYYVTKEGEKYYLQSFNPLSLKHQKFRIPFPVHSIKSVSDHLLILIEKKGAHIGLFNLKLGKFESIIKNKPNDVFYGHVEIDHESKKMYVPERKDNLNLIHLRSLDDLQIVGPPIYQTSKEIHMISFLEKNRLAICIDDQKQSSIDVLNLENKNVNKLLIPKNYFRPGHITTIADGEMFVSGIVGKAYEAGAVLKYKLKKMDFCEQNEFVKMKPIFWMAHHPESAGICAVSPYGNTVVFMDKDTHKIINKEKIDSPFGVDVVDHHFVVIALKGLFYFNNKDFKLSHRIEFPGMKNILEDFHPLFA